MLGLDPTKFDAEVIRKTNETSLRAFPSVLDTEHPDFFRRLHRCSDLNLQMSEIDRSSQPKWIKTLRKLPFQVRIVGHLLRIYLTKRIDAEALRETVR
ncbi:hypothetical protein NDI39_07400 [Microcoleus sp. ZQ-A2]